MEGSVKRDSSCSVLVVEDDPSITEFVESVLRDEGYEVAVAADGEEGLRRVEQVPPNLILLDLLLPVIGGEAFLREVRQRRGTEIPIILMTAAREEAPEITPPAEGLVLKPFELTDLLAEVERVLGEHPCQ
jgi:DNA-binding response OmpR family regulator